MYHGDVPFFFRSFVEVCSSTDGLFMQVHDCKTRLLILPFSDFFPMIQPASTGSKAGADTRRRPKFRQIASCSLPFFLASPDRLEVTSPDAPNLVLFPDLSLRGHLSGLRSGLSATINCFLMSGGYGHPSRRRIPFF